MRRFGNRLLLGMFLLSVAAPLSASGGEGGEWKYHEGEGIEFTSGDFKIQIGNRIQARFTLEDPDDDDSAQGSFDIARYKLRFDGEAFEDWSFRMQLDLANGSETGSDLLEDAYVQFTKVPGAQPWLGQGKVPFGRQFMTDTGELQFVDLSIASERFSHGRDVGVSLRGGNRRDTYGYSVGIYNGNGINKDEGDNVNFLYVGRLIVTPLGEYEPQETDMEPPEIDEDRRDQKKEKRLAIGVAAMTNTIGTENLEETRVNRGVVEFAFKRMRRDTSRPQGWNVVAEFFTESTTPLLGAPGDELDTDGYYVQTGYLFGSGLEIAGRYSEILPESREEGVGAEDVREIGLAANYYFPGHHKKIQVDFRTLDFDATTGDPFIDRYEVRVQLQLVF